MVNQLRQKGNTGEDRAVEYLKAQNYNILTRNYRCRLGEIDVIAEEKDYLVFIEIKTRHSLDKGLPQESVNIFKQQRIIRTAIAYIKENKCDGFNVRFDVVSVYPEKIELIRNAFMIPSGKYTI